MLRFGPETGPVVVVAMPLFEEANRMRAFAVTLCRLLAERGLASVLPDLPGQGESLLATKQTTLATIRRALDVVFEQVYRQGRHAYSASIRSGALAGSEQHAFGYWYLSPKSGRDVVHELRRILQAGGRGDDALQLRHVFQADAAAFPMEIAGNLVGSTFLEDLATDQRTYPMETVGVSRRIVRLSAEAAEAHRHVPGLPLWRRAEPGNNLALAALLADDIAEWIARCGG